MCESLLVFIWSHLLSDIRQKLLCIWREDWSISSRFKLNECDQQMRSADFNLGWRSEEIIYMEIFSWRSEVTATASGVPNALTVKSNHWIRTTIVDTIYLKRQSTWHMLLARYKIAVQGHQWRVWGKYCSESTVYFLKTRDCKVLSVTVVTRARVSTEEGCYSVNSVDCI